ncbi:hypothetical protein BDY19DRAFT_915802 [Irpex rosettiformis]|uniref:Uncharacterized protein n=1 Tax=Irpex rosettiformis TaxID=378272 RepID=A0ACB8UKY5_9APHY|nr:hypothetical protein BDY19DRAFT_915802 [Irpex rosettiformis]
MVKSKKDTIAEFNEQVNMSVEELEEWLQDPQSKKAGTGVGIESAAKIIEILKKNPTKDPSKYDEEDLEHMRKVVGYNKRHLAQESHLKDTKTKEELANTKSTISLKNWGHVGDWLPKINSTYAQLFIGPFENSRRRGRKC